MMRSFNMKCSSSHLIILTLCCMFTAICLYSCSSQRKLESLRRDAAPVQLEMYQPNMQLPEVPVVAEHRDTLRVIGNDGREVTIMNAVQDENGEMVANDRLDAAVVSARFRNVAERDGKVDLRFDVIVPERMMDSNWQIRLRPEMTALGETVPLDAITISGSRYREAQLRGYQRYQRFLDSIITDSSLFVNARDLEIFLRRNIPQVYKYRNDTSYVSEMEFASSFGVTHRQALDHYTSRSKIRRNDRRVASVDKMYARYVKVPIVTQGIRLDTVLTGTNGEFIYSYLQSLNVRNGLTRADIVLDGEIYREDTKIMELEKTDPLTFYISSLSSLADDREKYLTHVIERVVQANSVCWIDFAQGSTVVDTLLGNNAGEIGRIKQNLTSLLEGGEYEIDSILVTASCSPEGSFNFNKTLSMERSKAIASYFGNLSQLRFIADNVPENWEMLRTVVSLDDSLDTSQKEAFARLMDIQDLDDREDVLSRMPVYKYFREKLYPRLRTVRFDFCMHRAGMLKDTVHTTVPDTVYMKGLQALKEHDYQSAVTLLRPYNDYNTAVAYCAMGYNASAMQVLKDLEPGDKEEYVMALLCSRNGEDATAVQHYLNACTLNPSFVHRGNLDPEIYRLIDKYQLNDEFY